MKSGLNRLRRTGVKWALKQKLAKPSFFYGDGGTIHHTGHVDVETTEDGKVVAVWFRCMMLPFKQFKVDDDRAWEMVNAYSKDKPRFITGIEVLRSE